MIGTRFGRLIVIEDSIEKPTHYLCKCDCGNIKLIDKKSLKYGRTKSCGCLHKEKVGAAAKKIRGINENDFIGQKFSRWTVESVNGKDKYGQWHYICICDCGNKGDVSRVSLISGKSQSCGCLNSELTTARLIKRHSEDESYLDFIGQKFGMLTVIGRSEKINNDGRYEYICKCECGKETNVLKSNLTSGRTMSCGCYNSALMKKRFEDYRISKGYDKNIFMNEIFNTLRNNTFGLMKHLIIELDQNKCVLCNSTTNLHVHHINPLSNFLDINNKDTYINLYNVENLICLCRNCHKKAHKKKIDLNIQTILLEHRKKNPINQKLKNEYSKIEINIKEFINNFNYNLISFE
jgi:hypothetical protein